MKGLLTFLMSLVLLQGGCATRGRDFPSDISWIKKDKTTKQDVLRLLGEPQTVGHASGSPTWLYGYYNFRLFSESSVKELKFYWNRNGVVENFSFSSSFPDDLKNGATKAAPKDAPAKDAPGDEGLAE